MSNHVYKLIELVGSSTISTDDAIRNAIETAALTLRHIDWFEVMETRGHMGVSYFSACMDPTPFASSTW